MALIPSPLRCPRPERKAASRFPLGRQLLPVAVLLPLLLAACSGDTDPQVQNLPPARPPAALPAPDAATPQAGAAPQAGVGLTPLPTPAAVLGSLPVGRPDPFAATGMAGGNGAADGSQGNLPDGFRFSGVIRSSGQAQALVQVGGESGPICVGTRGICPGSSEGLLPAGWSVVAIDVSNGCLTLSQAGQRQRHCLS